MMRISTTAILALFALAGCGADDDSEISPTATYNIDASRITTSGVSAGAYMAGQLHIAHSSIFTGAGLIAGGPYYCASGSMQTGLGPCMKGGEIPIDAMSSYLQEQAESGNVDATDNLAGDVAWVFHGEADGLISADVTAAAAEFYAQHTAVDATTYVDTVDAPHGMPTVDSGVACDVVESPFLNACSYDAAGELLEALHGSLEPRGPANGELLSIPQIGAADADMLEYALLYVPEACADGEPCGVHVALHGCQQSTEFVDQAFALGAGYNEWADNNRLLILYPQVASSKLAPLNPMGCWDWWGYTGEDYATQNGSQVATIMATLASLRGAAE